MNAATATKTKTASTVKVGKTPKHTVNGLRVITNLRDLQGFEKIHAKCSKQYVPILTSDYIREIRKDFPEVQGRQYQPGCNAHYVNLMKPDSDLSVYIENSFDRSLAMRISFKFKNFTFGFVSQIHRGSNAVELADMASDFRELYANASLTLASLQDMKLPREDLENIAREIFKARHVKVLDDEQINGLNYNHSNTLGFINYMIQNMIDGNFCRKDEKTGKYRQLRPITTKRAYVNLTKKTWDYLVKTYPELQIGV